MKNLILLALALLIAVLPCVSAPAEENVSEQYFEGFWADPAFDRMELVILPSEVTWLDERMGQEAGAQKYVVVMSWPSSDSETTVYHIVGTLDDAGKILSYEGGLLGEYIADENGGLDEEETGLLFSFPDCVFSNAEGAETQMYGYNFVGKDEAKPGNYFLGL